MALRQGASHFATLNQVLAGNAARHGLALAIKMAT